MFILFVSDIHLSTKKPHVIEGFLRFLYSYAINAEALYILGDLFEIWIGDDDPNPLHVIISNALKHLNTHYNTKCYFIHGNHDFLLGQNYAKNCGMTILPNQNTLEFLGYRIIMLHGDTLCINDKIYNLFRKYVHQSWLQKIFLTLPISVRLYIGYIIQNIKFGNRKKILNINHNKIIKILSQTKTDIMIHGHIHQPSGYYQIITKKKKLKHVILGSWNKKGSIVEISKNGINLKEFILKN